MGGLWSVFKKVIPIIMLVCFICLGITHTFQETGQPNPTYLTQKVYTNDQQWINIEDATPEQIEDGTTAYVLDVNSYMQNTNINILKSATSNAIDTQTFLDTLNTFNDIWKDGYQLFDGVHTILNSVILIINTIFTIINLVIVPIRIIAGLILTGLSLVGINISHNGIILNSLRTLLNLLTIPLINPAFNADSNTTLNGTSWTFTLNPDVSSTLIPTTNVYNVKFTSNQEEFTKIRIWNNSIEYSTFSTTKKVYTESNGWINDNYRTIQISNINELTDTNVEQLTSLIWTYCQDNRLQGSTWTWNNNPSFTSADAEFKPNINFTSNNTNYDVLRYGLVSTDNLIYYGNSSNNNITMVYQNQTWTNDNYKTFTISNNNENITIEIADKLLATFSNNATKIT